MLSVLAPQHCAIEYCVCSHVELGLGSISMHIPFKTLLGLPELQTLQRLRSGTGMQCAGHECPSSAYAGCRYARAVVPSLPA